MPDYDGLVGLNYDNLGLLIFKVDFEVLAVVSVDHSVDHSCNLIGVIGVI